MSHFSGAIATPAWFDPMALLLAAVGPTDPRYVWWNGLLGNSCGQQLLDMDLLCGQDPLPYSDFTPDNIANQGLQNLFVQWMKEYFQSLYLVPN